MHSLNVFRNATTLPTKKPVTAINKSLCEICKHNRDVNETAAWEDKEYCTRVGLICLRVEREREREIDRAVPGA